MKRSYLTATDLFCGAGGSSSGIVAAGVEIRSAANHWRLACHTYATNHGLEPQCADVSVTHPSRFPLTDLLWASPECTNYSTAKGRKRTAVRGQLGLGEEFGPLPDEAEERSRATMWDVVRFAEFHTYELIVVENVVDIWDWSLLPAWRAAITALGYEHRALFLNSMFFWPTPQSRDRVYIVCWRKGNRAPNLDYRPLSWCPSCERQVEAVQTWKRPDRAYGRFRAQYVYACPDCRAVTHPYAYPAAAAIDWDRRGERIGDHRFGPRRDRALADATLARIRAGIERYWGRDLVVSLDRLRELKMPLPVDYPLTAQTGRQDKALLELPFFAILRGTSVVRDVASPLSTVTAGGGHHGLVQPPLYVKNFGKPEDAGPMAHLTTDPLGTVTAQDHHALLTPPPAEPPFLVELGYDSASAVHRHRPITEPMHTIPAAGNHHFLVQPPLVVDLDRSYAGHGSNRVRPVTDPQQTITAHTGMTRAMLVPYYSHGTAHDVQEPMAALTGHDRHAYVEVPVPDVEDCYFRMLEPPEIGRGMAFADDYRVMGNKREQVAQYGQAVTPPAAAWIIGQAVASLR